MMITDEQFRNAMNIVESYCRQIDELSFKSGKTSTTGCKVKLSSFGLEMQGKLKSKLVGTVVDYSQWMHYNNDGTVTVKWEGVAKPQRMHIHQVESLK